MFDFWRTWRTLLEPECSFRIYTYRICYTVARVYVNILLLLSSTSFLLLYQYYYHFCIILISIRLNLPWICRQNFQDRRVKESKQLSVHSRHVSDFVYSYVIQYERKHIDMCAWAKYDYYVIERKGQLH